MTAYPPPPPPPPSPTEEGGPVSSESKTWALIGWALGLIGAIIVMATKKEDKYAMFWAKQSLVLSIGYLVIYFVLLFLSFVFWPLSYLTYLVGLGVLIVWIIGVIKSYRGEWYKFPVLYDIAKGISL